MDQGIAALLGVIIGSILPSLSSLLRSKVVGEKFITALDIEIQEAKNTIHEKMHWISRDASCMKGIVDGRLLVESNNTMLLLGEDEDLIITLPFWEANIRDIVEIIPPKEFKRICNEIILTRKFLSKFRDMKMAFKVVMGDPA